MIATGLSGYCTCWLVSIRDATGGSRCENCGKPFSANSVLSVGEVTALARDEKKPKLTTAKVIVDDKSMSMDRVPGIGSTPSIMTPERR